MFFNRLKIGPNAVRPRGPLIDPTTNEIDLRRGQGFILGWHAQVGVRTGDPSQQQALLTVAFHDGGPGHASVKDDRRSIKTQLSFLLVLAMTGQTMFGQDRLNILDEIDRAASSYFVGAPAHRWFRQERTGGNQKEE